MKGSEDAGRGQVPHSSFPDHDDNSMDGLLTCDTLLRRNVSTGAVVSSATPLRGLSLTTLVSRHQGSTTAWLKLCAAGQDRFYSGRPK
jgi:hypothetical protein